MAKQKVAQNGRTYMKGVPKVHQAPSSTRPKAFVEALLAGGAARRTVEAYGIGAQKFEDFLARYNTPLEQAPAHTLNAVVAQWVQDKLSPSSVKLYMTGVRRYLRWLEEEQGYKIPKFHSPRLPRSKRRLRQVLDDAGLRQFLEVCRYTQTDPYATALMLLPFTGLRITEMCHMKLEDLEMVPPTVRWRVIERRDEGNVIKGDERIVPMLVGGNPILSNYLTLTRIRFEERFRKRGVMDQGYLFPNKHGSSMDRRVLQNKMRDVRKKLGMHRLTPHSLRHTYATILKNNGVDPFDIKAIMGHKSLNTTTIYVHPTATGLSERVAKIQGNWGKGIV